MGIMKAIETFIYWLQTGNLRVLNPWKARFFASLRAFKDIIQDASNGPLSLHAMSLVYTSMLAFVPLLALSFSVLHAFGVHNAVEPFLLNLLDPLGEQGEEITQQIVLFVDNINVGVLGFVGLIFLLFTTIGLIQKVENAFNYIWQIKTPRSFVQKFSSYLSVILVGPVLVFSALGITASLMASDIAQQALDHEVAEQSLALVSFLLPYALLAGALSFFYIFIPNTRVRFLPALVGGLIAAALWKLTGMAFSGMMSGSTRYDAIYSSFAIMILLLIWIYLNWLILLLGSKVTFFLQKPIYLFAGSEESGTPSSCQQEQLALQLMQAIGKQFAEGQKPLTAEQLAHRLQQPDGWVGQALQALQSANILLGLNQEPEAYIPARDIDSISLKSVVDAVRGKAVDSGVATVIPVQETLKDIDTALQDSLGRCSLKNWVQSETPQTPDESLRN
ncbi:tRNA-processing RNAse BN [Ectothiorhodosinus mongolicus]|uniref:tRNA-processing RNAse BN n=1 Tax=Ectothiorhodosinus mongolicus TaxID=233100 RepID=A0A1R3VZA8_9GAMM|nr:YihY/virulence factor BrkB family protein [Ectothiorhodosinus mongolicus]ULX57199.1 ribonuclease BN [Ectothiorhodosinus mongolicus]SIT70379.1 tRNA-processing RNAse BN [Ectothiorhodosinus mongolicus]